MHKIIILLFVIIFIFNGCSRRDLQRAKLLTDTVEFIGHIIGKVSNGKNPESNFDKNGINKKTHTKYDENGYDMFGYDKSGKDKNGQTQNDKVLQKKRCIAQGKTWRFGNNSQIICGDTPIYKKRFNNTTKVSKKSSDKYFYYPKNKQDCYKRNLNPIIASNGSLICQGELLNNKFNENNLRFTGVFISDDNNAKCATTGKIILNINNQELQGNIFYQYKNKKYKRKLWGKIENNEFSGETNRLKFYGQYSKNSDIMNGEYFNRVCKGTFKLYKDSKP
jgi:hypothetical protein